jgi:hypothetical protein
MDDRALMQAIVFLIVHLPGVDERRGRGRQPRGTTPYGYGGTSPSTGDPHQPVAAFDRGTRDADAKAVQHEDLGELNRLVG